MGKASTATQPAAQTDVNQEQLEFDAVARALANGIMAPSDWLYVQSRRPGWPLWTFYTWQNNPHALAGWRTLAEVEAALPEIRDDLEMSGCVDIRVVLVAHLLGTFQLQVRNVVKRWQR